MVQPEMTTTRTLSPTETKRLLLAGNAACIRFMQVYLAATYRRSGPQSEIRRKVSAPRRRDGGSGPVAN